MRQMLRALKWSRGPVRSVSRAVANAFLLALQTGCRVGEICGIRWGNMGAGFFRVDGRTGKRDVPAVRAAIEAKW